MKQYLLSVWHTGDYPELPQEQMEQLFKDVGAFNDQIQAEGAWVFGGGLFPADTATVVRSRGGDVLVTDGPFAETKEQMGGFWVVKATDLDAALAIAKRAALACQGDVEVRAFQDDAEE